MGHVPHTDEKQQCDQGQHVGNIGRRAGSLARLPLPGVQISPPKRSRRNLVPQTTIDTHTEKSPSSHSEATNTEKEKNSADFPTRKMHVCNRAPKRSTIN